MKFFQKTISFFLLIFIFQFSASFAPAAEEPEVPQRLLAVKRWKGTVTFSESHSGSAKNEAFSAESLIKLNARYQVDLPFVGDEDLPEWGTDQEQGPPYPSVGRGNASVSGNASQTIYSGGTTRVVYNTVKVNDVIVSLFFYPDHYEIGFSVDLETKLQHTFTSVNPGLKSKSWTEKDTMRGAGGASKPYPKTGFTLSGSVQVRPGDDEDASVRSVHRQLETMMAKSGFKQQSVYRLTWNLSPDDRPDFDLEVTPKNYEEWRPKGSYNMKEPGNHLQVDVQLKTKDGKKAEARQFTYELYQTSREPGVAMNWPIEGGDDPDFKFDPKLNPHLEISPEGQTAKSAKDDKKHKESVIISSYDWGGTTYLLVRAKLDGGDEVVGHLKGENRQHIPIPKREDGSHIADIWKKDNPAAKGKPDNWDAETDPPNKMEECSKHTGDGLTLFDEYRGFYALRDRHADNGHFDGNPAKKDYFVIDGIGDAMTEIFYFEMMTGLDVHGWMSPPEVNKERAVNFNKGNSVRNPVTQHAVELRRGSHRTVSDARSDIGFERPGTPGTLTRVFVGYGVVGDTRRKVISHELLHASNVWHHGDRDEMYVYWQMGHDADGEEVLIEKESKNASTGTVIEASFEEGMQVHPGLFKKPTKMWVARRHGQHSGNDHCVMRYGVADAYDPKYPPSNKRVIIGSNWPEPVGNWICESADGSGINAEPLKRHGAADRKNKRGACRFQICINDRYMYAHKERLDLE